MYNAEQNVQCPTLIEAPMAIYNINKFYSTYISFNDKKCF